MTLDREVLGPAAGVQSGAPTCRSTVFRADGPTGDRWDAEFARDFLIGVAVDAATRHHVACLVGVTPASRDSWTGWIIPLRTSNTARMPHSACGVDPVRRTA